MSELANPDFDSSLVANHEEAPSRLKHYVIGFVGSIALTLCAYLITYYHAGSRGLLFGLLAVLALTQFIIQLFFFLHIGREFSPRHKLLLTLFMGLIVFILVGGSLWIMFNLNGRVMPTQKQMVEYMNAQDNL